MESAAPQRRPLDRRNVAAVIPAYHEEVHVGGVAERTCAQLDHVVVIDDGSTDATAARAREDAAFSALFAAGVPGTSTSF